MAAPHVDRGPQSETPVLVSMPDESPTPTVYELVHKRRTPEAYEAARARYEAAYRVRIVEDSFADNLTAGVLLTQRRGWFHRNTFRTRLYYESGPSTPEVDRVIRAARRREAQYSAVLSARRQELLAKDVYATCAYLVTVLDAAAAPGVSPELRAERLAAAAHYGTEDLTELDGFAERSAEQSAKLFYLGGVIPGALLSLLIVRLMLGLPYDIGEHATKGRLALCLAFGAVGAVISVMLRMSRPKTAIEAKESRTATVLSGGFRPVVGAVFGAMMYILVTSGLLPLAVPVAANQAVLFFAGLAFIAGFNERWAQDTIVRSAPKTPEK